MADDLRAHLDLLLAQAGQRPRLRRLRHRKRAHEVAEVVCLIRITSKQQFICCDNLASPFYIIAGISKERIIVHVIKTRVKVVQKKQNHNLLYFAP